MAGEDGSTPNSLSSILSIEVPQHGRSWTCHHSSATWNDGGRSLTWLCEISGHAEWPTRSSQNINTTILLTTPLRPFTGIFVAATQVVFAMVMVGRLIGLSNGSFTRCLAFTTDKISLEIAVAMGCLPHRQQRLTGRNAERLVCPDEPGSKG